MKNITDKGKIQIHFLFIIFTPPFIFLMSMGGADFWWIEIKSPEKGHKINWTRSGCYKIEVGVDENTEAIALMGMYHISNKNQ